MQMQLSKLKNGPSQERHAQTRRETHRKEGVGQTNHGKNDRQIGLRQRGISHPEYERGAYQEGCMAKEVTWGVIPSTAEAGWG